LRPPASPPVRYPAGYCSPDRLVNSAPPFGKPPADSYAISQRRTAQFIGRDWTQV
jgi:hypothetical protein